MHEDTLRKLIKASLKNSFPKAHASWVESHATSPGFPDLDACHDGMLMQAELKVVKEGGKLEIRPTQYRWFKDRLAAGGNPVMIIGDDDLFYVIPGAAVVNPTHLRTMDDLKERMCFSFQDIGNALERAFFMSATVGFRGKVRGLA